MVTCPCNMWPVHQKLELSSLSWHCANSYELHMYQVADEWCADISGSCYAYIYVNWNASGKQLAENSLAPIFNFTSFQSVYSCLSVYRHNISPRFHHRFLFQLSSLTIKLPFYKNVSILHSMIVQGDIKIYCNNIKHCFFSKSCSPRPQCISLHNSGTKQPITSVVTLLHNWTSISGLISDFIKCGMCRVLVSGPHFVKFLAQKLCRPAN